MAKLGEVQNLKTEKSTAEEKACIIQKAAGCLRMVRTTPLTLDSIAQAKTQGSTGRIDAYFKSVFSRGLNAKTSEDFRREQFEKTYNLYTCFICEDRGYHLQEIEAVNGKRYDFAFACTCAKAVKAGSVLELVDAGLFRMSCKIGGEDGEYCTFEAKKDKCNSFHCPKFEKHLPG